MFGVAEENEIRYAIYPSPRKRLLLLMEGCQALNTWRERARTNSEAGAMNKHKSSTDVLLDVETTTGLRSSIGRSAVTSAMQLDWLQNSAAGE